MIRNAANVDTDVITFSNGIRMHRCHFVRPELQRHEQTGGLHEPMEEAWLLESLAAVGPDATFFDIGSMIGYYAILAKRTRPTLSVEAFEPLQLHRDRIQENLALNGLADAGVIVHPVALSSSAGTAKLEIGGSGSYLSHLKHLPPMRRARKRVKRYLKQVASGNSWPPSVFEKVTTATLDSYLAPTGRTVALAKMDVQGAEADVIRGAQESIQRGLVERWYVSTHSPELHAVCLALLQQGGYVIDYEAAERHQEHDGLIIAAVK